eukprot:scaffold63511_cov33-Cyclotella_meneghiniana.AAC.1
MGTSLRLHQVCACATLHVDKSSAGIVLNVDRTGRGKSHTMLLSCYGGKGIITFLLLTLTAPFKQRWTMNVIHLDEHCSDKRALHKVITQTGAIWDTGQALANKVCKTRSGLARYFDATINQRHHTTTMN